MSLIDLKTENVVKRYGAMYAVDHLSFEVKKGSFFSILGPSGCGKTTLLRMIAGFLSPDSGNLLIGGQSMAAVPPNRRPVNMVFQHLALFPMMTVGENVAYGLVQKGLDKNEIKKRVANMLERVSLPGTENKRVDQLSGGQKQRVAIARSLVLEPTLLLLDEPLGALDLKLREHMKIELKQLQAEFGTTFVYITHDQSEALVLSDQVAVMNQGKFEQVASPQDLYYNPLTPFVAGFVGANNKITAKVQSVANDFVTVMSDQGLLIHSRAKTSFSVGSSVSVFVRPEAIMLAFMDGNFNGHQLANQYIAKVSSLLFDGANSSVLLTEQSSQTSFQVALPQTGQFAGLKVGDLVQMAWDSSNALAFAQ